MTFGTRRIISFPNAQLPAGQSSWWLQLCYLIKDDGAGVSNSELLKCSFNRISLLFLLCVASPPSFPSSAWERALSSPLQPSRAPPPRPGSVPAAIWPGNVIWNSQASEGDMAGVISQRSWGGVLGVQGGGSRGGGYFFSPALRALGLARRIVDFVGRKWQRNRVCECSDC